MTSRGWLEARETGFILGMKSLVLIATFFGRSGARAVLPFLALYYTLAHRRARRASRFWLGRILRRDHVTLAMVFRHFLTYAQVTLDRLFLVRRQLSHFRLVRHGTEELMEASRRGQGGILLSAHLGSFEALRVSASQDSLKLNIVGYFRNARMINSVLSTFDPGGTTRLIEVDPEDISFVFKVWDCVERGEHVGILCDRVGLGGQTVEVDLLGGRSVLPAGAFLLASTLACPVYLAFALYRGPNDYVIHCEHFADRVTVPRKERKAALEYYAQRYADRLAWYARAAPYNWFNFFEF